jgi:hypothetical protein
MTIATNSQAELAEGQHRSGNQETRASVHVCPGCWRVAPQTSTWLQPRLCGAIKVAGGTLLSDRVALKRGDSLKLWRGEKVQLRNEDLSATAFFSWTYCRVQPTLRASIRQSILRRAASVDGRARMVPKIAGCVTHAVWRWWQGRATREASLLAADSPGRCNSHSKAGGLRPWRESFEHRQDHWLRGRYPKASELHDRPWWPL